MSFQTFSEANLRRILRPKDFFQSNELRTIDDFAPIIERGAQEVRDRTLKFDDIQCLIKRGKPVLKLPELYQRLIIRKLNDTLARVYKTRQNNRNKICRIVQTLLSDPTPYELIKLDIKSFFESVPRHQLHDAVMRNHIFSPETKWVFRTLFQTPAIADNSGLPRGLPISSTLSEKHLQNFDDRVKRRYGVFFFARFVDDIIVFTGANSADVIQFMEDELANFGLTINVRKTSRFSNNEASFENASGAALSVPDFDFLGYRFSKSAPKAASKVSISGAKIKKIKTRIAKSFLAYTEDKDASLLVQRIKLLTSNYCIVGSSSKNPLRTGIFYNYSIANDAAFQLNELDRFLKAQILAPNNIPSRRGYPLGNALKSALLRFTFTSGFSERKLHRFTTSQIARIKGCWQND